MKEFKNMEDNINSGDFVSDVEAQARERLSKKYGPEVLKKLPFWARETLTMLEEVKLENEETTRRRNTSSSSSEGA